ncbi:zinc finger protein 493-like isoform X2 [Sphaeramia orbicularis]|uniref:zinc finger protein 493-like isoform X2 n=1 Tax=Sphaeramia orbicularis TaxID=375764 RepID=UPI00117E41D5|nr:zinc finger protein 493-like isoform X2 [Sphaeramia orbicularis]
MSQTLSDYGHLPLSSLRLIVPPLQLVSAVLWQIVQQGAVMYYGLLDDFVTTVLDTVPELLTYSERVQLVIGLRARVVLEMCRNDGFSSTQTIQPHLSRINTYIMKQDKEAPSSEMKASVTNFLMLVNTLVGDPCQRQMFYQKIFPTVFGLKYDAALQALMRKFLLTLQKLLPVPNLEQTSLWLSLSPTILKECVELMNQPEPLNKLIQHHSCHGHEVAQVSPCVDDCIISSLSYEPPSLETDEDAVKYGSMCVASDCHTENSLVTESENDEEKYSVINPEMKRNAQRKGQQQVEDLTEDQGASIEVILPFDESESTDEDMNKEWHYSLQTGGRTSSKSFKCFVCGQIFGSLRKLKRHSVSQSVCSSSSVSQNTFCERISLQPKSKSNSTEITASKSDNELLSLATDNLSKQRSLPSLEKSRNDYRLVCRVCGQVFTYPKNFDKHQKVCAESSKQERQTEPQCSTDLSHLAKPDPGNKTAESETGPSGARQESISSDSSEEQMCKRSSRVKACSICGTFFTCSIDLTKHMRCHTEQSPYLCLYCGKEFDSYEDYETHQEGTCRVSSAHLLAQESSFNSRMKKNPKDTVVSSGESVPTTSDAATNLQSLQMCKLPMTCQECGQGFTYYKSFEKHQSKCFKRPPRKIKRKTNQFVIKSCNIQSAENASEIPAEIGSGTRESETVTSLTGGHLEDSTPVMKCPLCEKNFSKIVLMKQHYSKSHKVRGPYPCPICKINFVRLCELVRHQHKKTLYQCTACKRCYTKPGLLSDHEKVHTADVTPRICETCGKSFMSLAHLIQHQSRHKERQPCVCSHCGKQFSTKNCLSAHMVRHTGGYPCPLCGKKFFQKTYLKWHLYKHTGQEPYLCDTCGKGWPSVAQLKIHMIQHTEERPFKCEECDACYKRQSHLMAHRRAKHIRSRPFMCEVCSKTFRLNGELKKHMMVHTGERPYTCPRCSKTFTRKTRLREHREKACL